MRRHRGREPRLSGRAVILLLHNRYRLPGGEERAVDGPRVADPRAPRRGGGGARARLGGARQPRAPRVGLLRGGLAPEDVAHAVRRTGARVVHAHNVNPSFGWRALAAAREAGARVVLHLHNYRLVCAKGAVLHARGGLHALPRPRHAARACGSTAAAARAPRRSPTPPGSRSGSAGSPSRPTRSSSRARSRSSRLRDLGAPVGDRARVIGSVQREFAGALDAPARGASRSPPAGWRRRRASPTRSTPPARPGCRSWSPATARSAAELRERADGRRRPLHRRARARPSSPRCAARPPSRSCPPATPRSSRWPRSRRWRRACRSRPPRGRERAVRRPVRPRRSPARPGASRPGPGCASRSRGAGAGLRRRRCGGGRGAARPLAEARAIAPGRLARRPARKSSTILLRTRAERRRRAPLRATPTERAELPTLRRGGQLEPRSHSAVAATPSSTPICARQPSSRSAFSTDGQRRTTSTLKRRQVLELELVGVVAARLPADPRRSRRRSAPGRRRC